MSSRRAVALLCFAMLAACSDRSPVAPKTAGEGLVTVNFVGPYQADGAVQIAVHGPGIAAVTAARSDYVVFNTSFTNGQRIAVFGSIEDGTLVTFRVPDLSRLSSYTIEIEQVADESGVLRTDLDAYTLELAQAANP